MRALWPNGGTSGLGGTFHVGLVALAAVGSLSTGGTGSAPATQATRRLCPGSAQTSAGLSIVEPRAISRLRSLSGLTWDQLALLLRVSRRTVHFWASGKPMSPSNELRVRALFETVRMLDRGSARANRLMLLAPIANGASAFDMLCADLYVDVLSALSTGSVRLARSTPSISAQARDARRPSPPIELFDDDHDRIDSPPTAPSTTEPL